MLVLQVGRAFDRVVLVDVGQDRARSAAGRSRASSSASGTVWLTILSMPPPASCLYFTRAMSGSMPVVSQSIMKLIVPVGASTVACALRKPCTRAGGEHFVPQRRGPRPCRYAGQAGVDLLDRVAVHLHHAEHRLAVLVVAVERPDRLGQLGAGQVGRAVQQRRDRAADAAGRRRESYGMPLGHEQAAEVRVAQARAAGTGGCSGRCRCVG